MGKTVGGRILICVQIKRTTLCRVVLFCVLMFDIIINEERNQSYKGAILTENLKLKVCIKLLMT